LVIAESLALVGTRALLNDAAHNLSTFRRWNIVAGDALGASADREKLTDTAAQECWLHLATQCCW